MIEECLDSWDVEGESDLEINEGEKKRNNQVVSDTEVEERK